MPCSWEGNRRSDVALVMRHRLQWFIHLRAHGLDSEMSIPPMLSCGVWPINLYLLRVSNLNFSHLLYIHTTFNCQILSIIFIFNRSCRIEYECQVNFDISLEKKPIAKHRDISANVWLSFTKFTTMVQNGFSRATANNKLNIFKSPRWRMTDVLNGSRDPFCNITIFRFSRQRPSDILDF